MPFGREEGDKGAELAPWHKYGIKKIVIAADVTDLGSGGQFWDDTQLERFEVETGNRYYFAYDGCLYINQEEYNYDFDDDGILRPTTSTGKIFRMLAAIPNAKKTPLKIKEGMLDAVMYSSWGCLLGCTGLTGIEFPSTWHVPEGAAGEACVFDDMAMKMYELETRSPITYYSVASGHPNAKSINGSIYSRDGKRLVLTPPMPAGNEIIVADGTETITLGALASYSRKGQTRDTLKIILPASVKEIEESAEAFGADQIPAEIYGYAGTAAERFARACGVRFYDITDTVGGFIDVPASSFCADSVLWAVEQSITNGTTNATFSPGATCTTSHILTFLWRGSGRPGDTGSERAAMTAWANGLGIDTSNLSAPCTRAAAVTYMWKAAGSPEPSRQAAFADVPPGADYARAVAWAVENGITNGTGDTAFSPNDTCTRGQIVTFLYRNR